MRLHGRSHRAFSASLCVADPGVGITTNPAVQRDRPSHVRVDPAQFREALPGENA